MERSEKESRIKALRESDLKETFARSGGPGGQNVNKVSTAVTLWDRASGISVTVQDSRSQSINRKLARERLLALVEMKERKARAERRAARERARRQNSPRPLALKRRILETKRKRSNLKKLRGTVGE